MSQDPRPTEPSAVRRWLEDAGVRAVILGFVDAATIVRSKVVPIRRFEAAASSGVGLSPLFNASMSDDDFALHEGFIDGPSGDIRLRADAGATVPLAAMPGWAWAPVDQRTKDGTPFDACPRTFARRIARAFGDRGLTVKAAFELEFSVGVRSEDGGFRPAHDGPGYSDIALVRNSAFVLDLIDAMEGQGLDLQQVHPEYADGQFELSIAPTDPVAAADASMIARQTVRAVAHRHGLDGSFAPQVEAGTGNGVHLHLSLWDGDRPLLAGGDGPAGMHDRGEAFTAGILAELPAIVGVTVPTRVGYLRLQPHHWSGAMRCWGIENREAALRFVAGTTEENAGGANVEVKPIDGTANPYLAVGALLAAALHGLETGDRLPPSTEEDPAGLDDDLKADRGVEQLPSSLPRAVEALAASAVLREAMGDYLFETFLATRRGEARKYEDLDDDELIARLRWRS
ncbi:MAG TPA: glutamine synthetase family protein [Actinomycetota bacterium]